MKRNKIAFLSMFIVGIIVAIGFMVATRLVSKKETVTIGWLGPLTGPASLLGMDNLKAVQMALKEYEDTKGRGESGDLSIRADGTSRGIYPSLYTLKGGKGVKD